MITPREIIEFWLADAETDAGAARRRSKKWYSGGPKVDEEICQQFANTLTLAEQDELDDWRHSSEGALALIILLDQFSRNVYRHTADAFKNDAKALQVARSAIEAGLDKELSWPGRAFLYHPFHHAESIEDQDMAVKLFERAYRQAPPEWSTVLKSFLDYARKHRDIVRQFGRFPHRNRALGRVNTEEETRYLKTARRHGQ